MPILVVFRDSLHVHMPILVVFRDPPCRRRGTCGASPHAHVAMPIFEGTRTNSLGPAGSSRRKGGRKGGREGEREIEEGREREGEREGGREREK